MHVKLVNQGNGLVDEVQLSEVSSENWFGFSKQGLKTNMENGMFWSEE